MRDRSMERAHLEEAQRHLIKGQQRVEEQRSRVAELERDGHDISTAQGILVAFETTLAQMIAHRDLILRELSAPDQNG